MPTEHPKCYYRELFVEKRKGARLVYDFSLTIGFSPDTRWSIDPKNPNEIIEYSIRRADLHLELINGNVDLKEGDKLGGKLRLSTEKKISSTKKTGDKETEARISAKASLTPSATFNLGGNEHQKENKYNTELQVVHLTVNGNFSNTKRPFWTFTSVDGYLNGQLTMVPLCAVNAKEKCSFTYSDKIVVYPTDIVITLMPKKLIDIIIPYKALRIRSIEKRIIKVISENEEVLEMKIA